MSNAPYDPKLKEAAAEIKALCRRYDIAGAVALASPTHAEHLICFPDWVVVQFVGDGAVRIRCKREDYDSQAAQHEALETSAHVIMRFKDLTARHFLTMEAIENAIRKAGIEIEHDSGGYTPHREH